MERTKVGSAVNEEIKAIRDIKESEAEAERQRREQAELEAQEERKNAQRESDKRKKAELVRDAAVAENAQAQERLFVLENNFTSNGEHYKHAMHLSVNFAKEIRGIVSDFEDLDLQNTEEVVGASEGW